MSLLLYLYKSFNKVNSINKEGIYTFAGSNIIGIEKHLYSAKQRFEIQQQYNLEPFYFTQENFFNIILNMDTSSYCINRVEFSDDSIDETTEYETLNNAIINKKNEEIFDSTKNIIDEFDTDINKITMLVRNDDMTVYIDGAIWLDNRLLDRVDNISNIILGV